MILTGIIVIISILAIVSLFTRADDAYVNELNRLMVQKGEALEALVEQKPEKTLGVVTTNVKGVQSPEVGAKRIKPREREKFWIDLWLESWERQVGSKYVPIKGHADFRGPFTVDDVQLHAEKVQVEALTPKSAQEVNSDFQFLLQALNRGEDELARSLEILRAQGHIADGRMLTHEERRQKWERQQVMDRPAPAHYLYTQRELTEAEMLKRDIEEYNRKLETREYITQMEAAERAVGLAMSMPSPMTKYQILNGYYK